MTVPVAASATHQHLLAVLATELPGLPPSSRLRLLDAGCGDGELISFLAGGLPAALDGDEVELHGFDVTDHGLQPSEFLDGTIRLLSSRHPGPCWSERIRSARTSEPWPFPDGSFQAVISNQVLEHVRDHDFFMAETARVLAPGGFAVHVFPSKLCLWEPHLHLPVAHWIRDHDRLSSYIAALSRLGLGKYRAQARQTGVSVEDYARYHADYLAFLTNYKTESFLFEVARAHGLRPSSRYVEQYYVQKFLRIRKMTPLLRYSRPRLRYRPGRKLLTLMASTTLFLQRP